MTWEWDGGRGQRGGVRCNEWGLVRYRSLAATSGDLVRQPRLFANQWKRQRRILVAPGR
jgi:hypothetical protein